MMTRSIPQSWPNQYFIVVMDPLLLYSFMQNRTTNNENGVSCVSRQNFSFVHYDVRHYFRGGGGVLVKEATQLQVVFSWCLSTLNYKITEVNQLNLRHYSTEYLVSLKA